MECCMILMINFLFVFFYLIKISNKFRCFNSSSKLIDQKQFPSCKCFSTSRELPREMFNFNATDAMHPRSCTAFQHDHLSDIPCNPSPSFLNLQTSFELILKLLKYRKFSNKQTKQIHFEKFKSQPVKNTIGFALRTESKNFSKTVLYIFTIIYISSKLHYIPNPSQSYCSIFSSSRCVKEIASSF